MKKNSNKVGWLLYDEKNKRILLHKRDHRPEESPDMWDCFGGEVEKDDKTEYEAFLRELCEELGVTTRRNRVIESKLKDDSKMYYVQFPMEKTSSFRLGEGAGFVWLSIGEALKLKKITEDAKTILKSFKFPLSNKNRGGKLKR